MNLDMSDKDEANKSPAASQTRETREAELDSQLRKLYEAYGEGEMPEEIRKLAEALDRERSACAARPASDTDAKDEDH